MIYLDYRDYIEHKHIGNISKRKAAGLLEPAVMYEIYFFTFAVFSFSCGKSRVAKRS